MSRRGPQDRTAPRGGALAAAHRGYAYQDLVAAYLLVRALVERFESVVVDRKIVDDDRFDDVFLCVEITLLSYMLLPH